MMTPAGLECDIEITEEDGGFVAHCPNPEVTIDGKTPEETMKNLREALALYFDDDHRG
jgi:predicted RNase H-like HicB family nuclease